MQRHLEKTLSECGEDVRALAARFHLRLGTHPTLPLVVLNYDVINSPKNDPTVALCRGIVFQVRFIDDKDETTKKQKKTTRKKKKKDTTKEVKTNVNNNSNNGKKREREIRFERVVSKGLDRFFHFGESADSNRAFGTPVEAQIKEDGTYLHLFCFRGQWIVSTRHNFGEDVLPTGTNILFPTAHQQPVHYSSAIHPIRAIERQELHEAV